MQKIPSGFDYFGFYETPSFILCNPDKTPLHAMAGLTNRKINLNLNALSTLSFTAYPKVDDVDMPYYDLLKSKRLILVDGIGYFIITEVTESLDGLEKYKNISANSLEAELIFKKVNLVTGTYKFYDLLAPETSLLGLIFADIPNWTIATVDVDLLNKYRYFEVTDTTVYNFLMTTVEEAIECVFVFDTINRTISAYSAENVIKPTNIYLSHDNLILQTQIKELTDELFTAMYVTGGGDLSIYSVNPLGNGYIYNFDYYKNTTWMSQELIDAINVWENNVTTQKPRHDTLILDYFNNQTTLYGDVDYPEDTGLYGQLDALKKELQVLEIEQSSKIAKLESLTDVNNRITLKNGEITTLQNQIDSIEGTISDIIDELGEIATSLSLQNNFTSEQYSTLTSFIIETSYQNENFMQTDIMSGPEIQVQAQQLYNQAYKVLERISQPRYEFQIDSLNLIFMQEFATFSNQLELGAEIYAELSDNIIHKPILLQINLNYDNPSEFSMVFGNRLRLDSSEFIFADLFGKSVEASTSVSLNSATWNSFETNYKDKVTTFLTSALDASKNAVVSSANQEFIIDASGIRGRMLDGASYSPKQTWINNSTIAFTDDGWNTAKLALGEVYAGGTYVGYGLVGDVIVGKLIAGNQLIIENESGSFYVDGNGVTVTGSTFGISDGDPVDPHVVSLTEAFQEIIDSTTTTYYSATEPIEANSGDLWFDTDDNKLYRYNGTTWDLLEDGDVAEAFAMAEDAIEIADGKIVTFYQDDEPTTANYGDLWFDTNDSNKPYRYNGSTWNSVADLNSVQLNQNYNNVTINATSGITVEKSNLKNKIILNSEQGIQILQATGTPGIYNKTIFSIDPTTGNATFAGSLSAVDGTFTGDITGATGTFTGIVNASDYRIGGESIIEDDKIQGDYIENIDAGTITAGILNGITIQTSTSGKRIVIDGNDNAINIHDENGTMVGQIDWDTTGQYPDDTNRVFIRSAGVALKLEAENANMSIEADTIYFKAGTMSFDNVTNITGLTLKFA